MATIYTIEGKEEKTIELPEMFSYKINEPLIKRAVIAERSYILQPQGHYVLAGLQTTAKYFGRMNSYRSGRHMGIAIRPREKLGDGRQGKVKKIPSATKVKRAHPNMIQKKLVEKMNNIEYQNALISSISASKKFIIVNNDIEKINKTKDILKVLDNLNLGNIVEEGRKMHIRKGLRRKSNRRHFKKTLLLVFNEDKGALKAARNVPGIDVCLLNGLTVNALAPGGVPGRITLWSEGAVNNAEKIISRLVLSKQAKYVK